MIFGITGGSGSGKTTVCNMLRATGADIIDLDVIARDVVSNGGECLRELREAFGGGIIQGDGTLDRKKLASFAFADAEKTAMLNKITHKYIKEEALRRIEASDAELIGLDGAVIIGSCVEPLCEKMVCVVAGGKTRVERIKSRDGLSDYETEKRLSAQPSDEYYIEKSDYIIENNGDINELQKSVHALLKWLKP